jgi:hypothetical protein
MMRVVGGARLEIEKRTPLLSSHFVSACGRKTAAGMAIIPADIDEPIQV